MKIHIFKGDQIIVFGIRYSKHLYIDNQHILVISFWKWDLDIVW